MLRSLFSAISGLRGHQTFMDVVGNNIANVNTTGYKASRVTFEDVLSQTTQGGTAPDPQAQRGGINPMQIGLGTQVASTAMTMAQGSLEATQSPTDLAIQGNGFFILNDGQGGRVYTRDGSFSMGLDGTLANANGLQLLGWTPDPTTGLIDPTRPLQPITIPTGDQMVGQASSTVTFKGNLDQRIDAGAAPPANQVTTTLNLYDSLGHVHQVTVTFTKTNNATNSWSWSVSTTEAGVSVSGSGTIGFDGAGAYQDTNGAAPDGTITLTLSNGATSPQTINVSFGSLTQVAANTSVDGAADGAAPGSLTNFSIGANGEVTGVYSNGLRKLLGQVALASFTNPQGLLRQGGNVFTTSPSSGDPVIGAPGSGGRGQLSSGFLEMSNVDLAQEFTNMILAERGFQASSRVITTSDEILQDLVNLKHP